MGVVISNPNHNHNIGMTKNLHEKRQGMEGEKEEVVEMDGRKKVKGKIIVVVEHQDKDKDKDKKDKVVSPTAEGMGKTLEPRLKYVITR